MNGTTHSGLSPSTSISKQGHATQTYLLAFLIEAFPQLRRLQFVSSEQKITSKQNQTAVFGLGNECRFNVFRN